LCATAMALVMGLSPAFAKDPMLGCFRHLFGSAQSACLPESNFVTNVMAQFPVTNLGFIDYVLTACI